MILRPCALVAAALALAGCTYSVEVRNATPDPITVRLIQLDPVQPEWLLASARIDPGDRARLRESRVAFEKVVLEATTPGRDDEPVRTRVKHGTRVFRVEPGPTADRPIVFVDDPTPWVIPSDRMRVVETAPPGGDAEKPR